MNASPTLAPIFNSKFSGLRSCYLCDDDDDDASRWHFERSDLWGQTLSWAKLLLYVQSIEQTLIYIGIYALSYVHTITPKKYRVGVILRLYMNDSHWFFFLWTLMNNCTHFVHAYVEARYTFITFTLWVLIHIYPVFRWVMIGLRDALRRTGLADIFAAIANTLYGIEEERAKITYLTHIQTQRITRKTRTNNALNNVIYWIT